MTLITTVGAEPARIDIAVNAGEPVDFTVPVYDSTGAAQDLSGWTLAGTVKAATDGVVLYTFTTAEAASDGGVTVTASGGDTAGWANWSVSSAPWTLWLTPSGGGPTLFAAGWVRVTSL